MRRQAKVPAGRLLGAVSPLQDAAATSNDRFLDAVEQCFLRFGVAKTTMEDVANAAGVSRATLYRTFKDRDELLLAAVARAAFRLAAEAEIYCRRFDDVGSWIVEGLLFSLRELPRRPLIAMLHDPEHAGRTSALLLQSPRLLQIGIDVLRPMFEPARERGLLREGVELPVVMEWVLRVLVSYLNTPSLLARSEEDLRRLFRLMILPAVLKHPELEARRTGARRKEKAHA